MPFTTTKKLLMSMIVVGILASFTVGGTFAIFNGTTKNPAASIAAGSVVMANSVGGAANCYSNLIGANSNVNTSCTTLFTTSTPLYPITSSTPPTPPQTTVAYGDVAITSAGLPLSGGLPTASTLPATLSVYMPNCDPSVTTNSPVTGTNPCCPGLASGLPGSVGNCPTGGLDFFIQEYTSSAFTTPMPSCLYPAGGAACTFQSNSLGTFFGNYHDNTHYFSLGSITAGQTRYFRIGLAEPIDDVNNTLQGETATFSLYWHMEQE